MSLVTSVRPWFLQTSEEPNPKADFRDCGNVGDKGFLTVELRRKVVGPGSNENTTAVELGNNSTFIESGINQTLLALGSNSTFSGSGSDAIILE